MIVYEKILKIDLWMYNLDFDLITLTGLKALATHRSNDVLTSKQSDKRKEGKINLY